jgi:hypothetical protein
MSVDRFQRGNWAIYNALSLKLKKSHAAAFQRVRRKQKKRNAADNLQSSGSRNEIIFKACAARNGKSIGADGKRI